mmetsp:Transcript_80247/g.221907  ORF Transcript_80247/g.221907 Transcript_80247/m.221907 type:complete len:286 (-) Transcript_80247:25-882(-)
MFGIPQRYILLSLRPPEPFDIVGLEEQPLAHPSLIFPAQLQRPEVFQVQLSRSIPGCAQGHPWDQIQALDAHPSLDGVRSVELQPALEDACGLVQAQSAPEPSGAVAFLHLPQGVAEGARLLRALASEAQRGDTGQLETHARHRAVGVAGRAPRPELLEIALDGAGADGDDLLLAAHAELTQRPRAPQLGGAPEQGADAAARLGQPRARLDLHLELELVRAHVVPYAHLHEQLAGEQTHGQGYGAKGSRLLLVGQRRGQWWGAASAELSAEHRGGDLHCNGLLKP